MLVRYNPKDHVVTVDGVIIQSFCDDEDAISCRMDTGAVVESRGLDRNAPSFSSRGGAALELRLKPDSPSVPILNELKSSTEGEIRMIPVSVTKNGIDVLTTTDCYSISNTNRYAQSLVFELECANYEQQG